MTTSRRTSRTRTPARARAKRSASRKSARAGSRTSSPTRRASRPTGEFWSQRVTRESDALDLEPGVFALASPRAVAESLKRSADRSTRRKTDPFRSAMSMLVFYVNRAGRKLSKERKRVLDDAKDELRALFGRSAAR